jgi:hypothetical protein
VRKYPLVHITEEEIWAPKSVWTLARILHRMEKDDKCLDNFFNKLEPRDHLEDLDVDGRILQLVIDK